MKRIKLLSILVLTALGIVLILQNTQPTQARLLVVTVTMPRAVLILLAGLIGFGIGLLTALNTTRRR